MHDKINVYIFGLVSAESRAQHVYVQLLPLCSISICTINDTLHWDHIFMEKIHESCCCHAIIFQNLQGLWYLSFFLVIYTNMNDLVPYSRRNVWLHCTIKYQFVQNELLYVSVPVLHFFYENWSPFFIKFLCVTPIRCYIKSITC